MTPRVLGLLGLVALLMALPSWLHPAGSEDEALWALLTLALREDGSWVQLLSVNWPIGIDLMAWRGLPLEKELLGGMLELLGLERGVACARWLLLWGLGLTWAWGLRSSSEEQAVFAGTLAMLSCLSLSMEGLSACCVLGWAHRLRCTPQRRLRWMRALGCGAAASLWPPALLAVTVDWVLEGDPLASRRFRDRFHLVLERLGLLLLCLAPYWGWTLSHAAQASWPAGTSSGLDWAGPLALLALSLLREPSPQRRHGVGAAILCLLISSLTLSLPSYWPHLGDTRGLLTAWALPLVQRLMTSPRSLARHGLLSAATLGALFFSVSDRELTSPESSTAEGLRGPCWALPPADLSPADLLKMPLPLLNPPRWDMPPAPWRLHHDPHTAALFGGEPPGRGALRSWRERGVRCLVLQPGHPDWEQALEAALGAPAGERVWMLGSQSGQ